METAAQKIRDITQAVFGLYEAKGDEAYLGEEVTQLEHATQCAMLAQKEGRSHEVVLAAFLHDVGHLLGKCEAMEYSGVNIGSQNHETLGAEFLEGIGVPPDLSVIARWHVDAKRYLCRTEPTYYDKLSQTSKQTLELQGGIMTIEEATTFEKIPQMEMIIRGRRWDEQAKVVGLALTPLSVYKDMFRQHLASAMSTA